jgi:hypothetical protein
MILVIDATATDLAGNVLAGSVAVTVNDPAPAAQEQVAADAERERIRSEFQKRSIMMARGAGYR